jgi:membrane fusion protein, multidrug efflux system
MFKSRIASLTAILIAASVMGCEKATPPRSEARPVRTVTVERNAEGEAVSQTGHVRAKDEASLAFRLDGRMIDRPVHVGDVVKPGQVIARLDPQNQENALRSAQADLASAEAVLEEARLAFWRQQQLLKSEATSKARFDEAQQKLRTSEAQVNSAQAQRRIAQDRVGYATLSADSAGVITAVGAEAGEVVRAGQMILQLAHDGPRDALFDVSQQLIRTGPRDPLVEIALTDDPQVKATGRVREIAPEADSATRTFRVKVAIIDPPEAMRLGSTVTGRIRLTPPPGVEVPASALTEANGHPAVWVVDAQNETVSLRDVGVLRYDPATVVISEGLAAGDVVVTAGVQTLRPGQKVRRLGGVS